MTRLIVDSTCDLPDELLEKYAMRVLPLHITINDKEYRDKIDIQVDEIYNEMRNGTMPQTSQVSSSDINDLFEEYCSKGYDFIFIAISSGLSGTYQTAESIVKEYKEKYPHLKMDVVDSKSGSLATGLIALQAGKMIQAGYEHNVILEQLTEMSEHIEHIFSVSDLKWLIKGGRVDKLQGIIGSILNVKPLLQVKNGSLNVFKKVIGRNRALAAITDTVAERIKYYPDQIIGITHSDDSLIAEELHELLIQRIGNKEYIINTIGSVIASHIGIGGVGVFFFNKKPSLSVD